MYHIWKYIHYSYKFATHIVFYAVIGVTVDCYIISGSTRCNSSFASNNHIKNTELYVHLQRSNKVI